MTRILILLTGRSDFPFALLPGRLWNWLLVDKLQSSPLNIRLNSYCCHGQTALCGAKLNIAHTLKPEKGREYDYLPSSGHRDITIFDINRLSRTSQL